MADEASPELPQICAVMVHDLKNPLAALMTNLRFLIDLGVVERPDAAEALADSSMLCDVLDRYLRNLDLLARADATSTRRLAFPIFPVVRDAVAKLGSTAGSHGVEVALATDGADATVEVDRDLFTRAIENTIANAIENCPRGSRVDVSIESNGDEVSLVVRDARTKIPAEAPAKQEPLGDSKRLQARYGRGLSLLVAEIAARGSGAKLSASGSPGAFAHRLAAPRPGAAQRGNG